MIRNMLIIFTILLLTSACSRHYFEVKNDELHIYLKEPDAKKVYLLCSLDQFEPRPAINANSGIWETVLPSDKEFKYFFLVDGSIFIPACEMKEKDDFVPSVFSGMNPGT